MTGSRERFEACALTRNLDLTQHADAWGRPVYHDHIECMWSGWQASERSAIERAIAHLSKDDEYFKAVHALKEL